MRNPPTQIYFGINRPIMRQDDLAQLVSQGLTSLKQVSRPPSRRFLVRPRPDKVAKSLVPKGLSLNDIYEITSQRLGQTKKLAALSPQNERYQHRVQRLSTRLQHIDTFRHPASKDEIFLGSLGWHSGSQIRVDPRRAAGQFDTLFFWDTKQGQVQFWSPPLG